MSSSTFSNVVNTDTRFDVGFTFVVTPLLLSACSARKIPSFASDVLQVSCESVVDNFRWYHHHLQQQSGCVYCISIRRGIKVAAHLFDASARTGRSMTAHKENFIKVVEGSAKQDSDEYTKNNVGVY